MAVCVLGRPISELLVRADTGPRRKLTNIDGYNAVAKEVMVRHNIPITHLNAAVKRDGKSKFDDGAQIMEACQEMARDVAQPIAAVSAKQQDLRPPIELAK
jgi:hypothetical protein